MTNNSQNSLQDVVIGYTSQSGGEEMGDLNQKESYGKIGTSRSKIMYPGGRDVNAGIDFSTEETTKKGAEILAYNFSKNFDNGFNISFHAMKIGQMINNYPEIFVKEFLKLLSELNPNISKAILDNSYKINALLISFDTNSNTLYEGRESKDLLGESVKSLKKIDLDISTKTAELIIFDSPSSKKLGLTYLGVVGQIIEFIENNSELDNGPLKDFLGEDYVRLKELFDKYPLSGEIKEGQISMKYMSERELKKLMNNVTSKINGAKFSYVSGIISKLYLESSMEFLRENKEEFFSLKGDKVLLDLETIKKLNKKDNIVDKFNTILNMNSNDNNLRTETDLFNKKELGDGGKILYRFNPSDKNFNIIGKHFGVIPLMITNDLVYKSGLLEEGEYIKSTKASSPIYTGNELLLDRITNERGVSEIVVSNIDNPSEIFATIKIVNNSNFRKKEVSEKGIVFEADEKEFDNSAVPHSKEWFNTFNEKGLADKPFGLDLDPKAVILEDIGVQIATKYFVNPKDLALEELKNTFGKEFNFTTLKGIFGVANTEYIIDNFDEEIKNIDYNFKITNIKYSKSEEDGDSAIFKVDVYNNDNLLISKHSFVVK